MEVTVIKSNKISSTIRIYLRVPRWFWLCYMDSCTISIGGNKIIPRVKLALVILAHDVWNNRMGKNPMAINN
jgi:hypothetical protein